MLRIQGSSFEEEMLKAECSGDEERERKLVLARECLDVFGWDIEVDSKFIDGLAAQYERIVT